MPPVSNPFMIRMPQAIKELLERRADMAERPKSQLALRYIEEGLRMDSYPGIYFRTGPAGRRPAVVGGPDVWEIARVLRDVDTSGEEAVSKTASLLGREDYQIRLAAHYYADNKDEIDDWIKRVDRIAADAEASWRRQQGI